MTNGISIRGPARRKAAKKARAGIFATRLLSQKI